MRTSKRAEPNFFPIQLNFEEYHDYTPSEFYRNLYEDIHETIENIFQKRGEAPPAALTEFLENTELIDHVSMRRFFTRLARFLKNQRVLVIIDEFDGIPQGAVSGISEIRGYTRRVLCRLRSPPASRDAGRDRNRSGYDDSELRHPCDAGTSFCGLRVLRGYRLCPYSSLPALIRSYDTISVSTSSEWQRSPLL